VGGEPDRLRRDGGQPDTGMRPRVGARGHVGIVEVEEPPVELERGPAASPRTMSTNSANRARLSDSGMCA
jgi:hypothetical protein